MAQWVDTQRQKPLARDRRQRLKRLRFDLSPRANRWEVLFARTKSYLKRYQTSTVPYMRKGRVTKLGRWVAEQRHTARHGRLSADRRARLEAIGLELDPHEAVWAEQVRRLKQYRSQHRDGNVPQIYLPDRALGQWLDRQKQAARKGRLSDARRAQLLALDAALPGPRMSTSVHTGGSIPRQSATPPAA